MRTAVLAAMFGAGLAVAALTFSPRRNLVYAQHARASSDNGVNSSGVTSPGGAKSKGEVITLAATVGQKHQQVVLVDPASRVMSVYHVDLASGEIALKSVRCYHWDLQLRGFNEVRPFSKEIRLMAQQR